MRFQRGITGFGPAIESSSTDLSQFRADCWQVARTLNANVETREPEPITNYLSQALAWPDLTIVVLLNKYVPIIGLCNPFEPGTVIFEYVDHARVADGFLEFGIYQVWTRAQLELPVKDDMCENLIASEQRNLKYWRKCHHGMRVGDLVFNHWD